VTASTAQRPATSLQALKHRQRRRVFALSILRTGGSVVVLLALYAVLPAEDLARLSSIAWLSLGLLLVVGVLGWQLRSIVRADYPGLRAAEALVLTITLFVIVFSLVYLSLSSSNPSSFSEHLDRVSAFYYTVSILSTVGFGDITALTDAARAVTTLQMLLDLTLVVVIVKVFVGSARSSLQGGRAPSDNPPTASNGTRS
jgi:voltage-gated potassium channel